ncbi:conserved hypothetical protein [Chloroherpeton thalassium ATCC 35110]|uniref:DUF4412 domain-containing protein n=1 Tax=Chloroherpeton thalassium (strain ATCC 35110 / GB-78) TaxID=517418 RepID=B3QSG6_CHLT3|nr:DUF4412 domain-containing protein [Chloroherpeton thalassium]ACF12557.1 conserved hypothetical protein [Chloroherpeton thalassium ATCC 35110]
MFRIILTFLVLNFYAAPIFAQFVGEIQMELVSPQGNGQMTFIFGSQAERMDMLITPPQFSAPMKTSMILKHENPDEAYILMDATKSYMVLDLKKAAAVTGGLNVDEEYDVKVIGKEKIRGYQCQHVKITGATTDMDLWLSSEILDFDTFRRLQSQNPKMSNSALADALHKSGADGFPVKMLQQVNGQTVKMELVKAEKKAIPASAFSIPKDYQQMQPQMQMSQEQMEKMKEMMKKLQEQKR